MNAGAAVGIPGLGSTTHGCGGPATVQVAPGAGVLPIPAVIRDEDQCLVAIVIPQIRERRLRDRTINLSSTMADCLRAGKRRCRADSSHTR